MMLLQQNAAVGLMNVVAKATLLLGIGCGGAIALRRAPAAARHLVWLIVIVGALLTPLVARVAPVRVAVLPRVASAPPVLGPSVGSVVEVSGPPPAMARLQPVHGGGAVPVPDVPISTPHYGTIAVGVWLGIAAALIGWLVAGMLSVRRILRSGRPLDSVEWTRALGEAAGRVGLTSVPRLILSDRVAMAFVCDVRSPTIVFPAEAAGWSADRRRAVLLHETAHLRRRDLIGNVIARVACAVYWFHPLMWLATRCLRAESERACDDLVLGSGVRASDYAQHLLDMVAGLGQHGGVPASALPMARRSEFEGRLHAILDRGKRRTAMGRAQFGALAGVLGLLAVSIAAVAPVRRVAESSGVASQANGPRAKANPSIDVSAPGATGQPTVARRIGVSHAALGAIQGIVIDSVRGGMLDHAVVQLLVTDSSSPAAAGRETITDVSGRFGFDSVAPDTRYRLRVLHPLLDTAGIDVSTRDAFTVAAGETRVFALSTPTPSRLVAELCPRASQFSRGAAMVTGFVRDANTNQPHYGVQVSLLTYSPRPGSLDVVDTIIRRWPHDSVAATGRYRFCGVPAVGTGTLVVEQTGVKIARLPVDLRGDLVVLRGVGLSHPPEPHVAQDTMMADLTMAKPPRGQGSSSTADVILVHAAGSRPQRSRPQAAPVVVYGCLVDSAANTPISGAGLYATAPAGDTAWTDSAGFFSLSLRIPPGPLRLDVAQEFRPDGWLMHHDVVLQDLGDEQIAPVPVLIDSGQAVVALGRVDRSQGQVWHHVPGFSGRYWVTGTGGPNDNLPLTSMPSGARGSGTLPLTGRDSAIAALRAKNAALVASCLARKP